MSALVGGQKIAIRIVDLGQDYGEYDHDISTIKLSNLLTPQGQVDTLRHELMHCALAVAGVSFSDSYEEESIVRCMEQIFFPAWDKLQKKIKL